MTFNEIGERIDSLKEARNAILGLHLDKTKNITSKSCGIVLDLITKEIDSLESKNWE